MSDRTDLEALTLTKFAIGQPVRRAEDQRLVRGKAGRSRERRVIGLAS